MFSQTQPQIPSFESRLLENVVKSSLVHLLRRMTSDRNSPQLHRMLELPVTAFLRHLVPPIILNQLQHVADFHRCGSTMNVIIPFSELGLPDVPLFARLGQDGTHDCSSAKVDFVLSSISVRRFMRNRRSASDAESA